MNKHRFPNTIAWILLVCLLLLSVAVNIVLFVRQDEVKREIRHSVSEEIAKVKIPQPKDGYTPVKNLDYFDGQNGINATDKQVKQAVDQYFKENPPQVINGSNGYTPQKGVDYFDGNPGQDGITPLVRCNTTKNRWEVRYGLDQAWQLLNNEKVKCTTEE